MNQFSTNFHFFVTTLASVAAVAVALYWWAKRRTLPHLVLLLGSGMYLLGRAVSFLAPTSGIPLDQMDRLFGDLSRSPLYGLASAPGFPALNIRDEGDALVVEAEVPGVSEADLEVVATGDELSIRGERAVASGDDATYHRRERAGGKFARTVELAVDIDASKVEASLDNGVLRVVLPKAAAAQPRTIPVSTSK